jgi:glyoxylase-like metal-dependent hydrolase (beta-lactamase superfamily II)
MTTVELIHPGYVRAESRVGSSISLIRDGDAIIVADPGLVASHARILEPLAERGVAPGDVTHVFLSHHHPDHTMNVALFPNAEVVDFWARYRNDLWLDHEGDGWQMTEHAQLWLTPGHSNEDASLIVRADDGVYALTHLWWHQDRTPDIDPFAPDQAILETQRARVLAAVDIVIPGHGAAFRVKE